MGLLSGWLERTGTRLGASHVFRPRTSYLIGVMWLAVTLIWVYLAARDGMSVLLAQIPVMLFLGTAVYAATFRPIVAIRRSDVLVRNVLRDIIIPWAALKEIGTQYALSLTTHDGHKYNAWAAPAASRFAAARATPSDLKTIQWDEVDGPPPASASLRSDSGAAAVAVRYGWREAQDRGPLPDQPVTIRWSGALIAALTVTLLASILAIALG